MWGCQPDDPEYARCRGMVYRAVRLHERAKGKNLCGLRGRGIRDQDVRTKRVDPAARRRALGDQGRRSKLVDLSHELFNWWVDMAETLQARVPTVALLAQAKVILHDAKQLVRECEERGEVPPWVDEPSLDYVWICRWRKQWNLTKQSVNCKYKVAFSKKVMRMGVTWRNSTRLLALHAKLFGPDRLTFVSVDEKPFRFNACGEDQIWARRGATKKRVREKRVALLERWTGITACYSR